MTFLITGITLYIRVQKQIGVKFMRILNKIFKAVFLLITTMLFCSHSIFGESTMNNYLPLYDFNETAVEPQFEWKGFTDQVMGGVSEISTRVMSQDDEIFIRMEGDVSLENNGGFIQISLRLASGLKSYNASEFDGIRLKVKAEGSGYYVFIRTSSTIFPWQFYKAPINTEETWQTVDLAWSDFEGGDYGNFGGMKPTHLKSIALVAYAKEFRAKIDMSSIGLYKK